MGMDISTWIEVRGGAAWQKHEPMDTHTWEWAGFPFNWRHYGMFAFLSDGENSRVKGLPHIDNPYRGLPKDSDWLNMTGGYDLWDAAMTRRASILEDSNNHGFSWVGLDELLAFDYDQVWQSPLGPEPVREELGPMYFEHLKTLEAYGSPENVRVVYYFN
jgi:hypothetical protein